MQQVSLDFFVQLNCSPLYGFWQVYAPGQTPYVQGRDENQPLWIFLSRVVVLHMRKATETARNIHDRNASVGVSNQLP